MLHLFLLQGSKGLLGWIGDMGPDGDTLCELLHALVYMCI